MQSFDKSSLFRMSFILQDSNASTVKKHLVKIVEAIIFDSEKEYLSVSEIRESIITKLDLEFDENEIEDAIKSKYTDFVQKKANDMEISISPKCNNRLSNKGTYSESLRKYVSMAIKELCLNIDIDEYCKLLTDYFYQSFNTNKNVILSLITRKKSEDESETDIDQSTDSKKLINAFLEWENDEKNEFIYKLISFCYVYCSLTVKKDNMLSEALFRGKRFYLDANIIFRLAGINNDSRKLSIASFINRSDELGIDLCYTNLTQEEINRVISSRVSWIKSIVGSSEPVDTSRFTDSEDDFFKIYMEWTKNNDYSDLLSFQKYLNRLIYDVTDHYRIEKVPAYIYSHSEEVDRKKKQLSELKKKRKQKPQSEVSLGTDICNVMFIEDKRGKSSGENMWSVNDYFISADQGLIAWANDSEGETIPIVVLPSVWLTIMLRFTSRTSDDYKAFCSFMELRTSIEPENFNVYKLLQSLATKTNRKELKERIIQEVYENKDKYDFEDYDEIANKVFDEILDEKEDREREELTKIRSELEKANKENAENTRNKIKSQEEQLQRIDAQVEKDINLFKKMCFAGRLLHSGVYIALWGIFLWFVLTGLRRMPPGYGAFIAVFPVEEYSSSQMMNIATVLVTLSIAILSIYAGFIKKINSYCFGKNRIAKRKSRLRNKYISVIIP